MEEPRFFIHDLQIPQDERKNNSGKSAEFFGEGDANCITGLSRLNVFVGPNNCGKSLLLRNLFSATDLVYCDLGRNEPIRQFFREFAAALRGLARKDEVGVKRIIKILDSFVPNLRHETGQMANYQPPGNGMLIGEIGSFQSNSEFMKFWENQVVTYKNEEVRIRNAFETARRDLDFLIRDRSKKDSVSFTRVYVPTLRGMRGPKGKQPSMYEWDSEKDFYYLWTIASYFSHNKNSWIAGKDARTLDQTVIVTGQEMYSELRRYLLGDLEQRAAISSYEKFLSKRFFDGNPVSLIPREAKDEEVLHIKIGSEKERPIYELGDGLQQLIIMTIPMFIHRNENLLLFIEEPELFLHPGFQRSLIDVILHEKFGESNWTRQVFVATHSNQFLDITVDEELCSIFRVSKKLEGPSQEQVGKFEIEKVSSGDFSVLNELGVRNSSVFLSNCTIWVEGVTDRKYYRKFLELYQDDLESEARKNEQPIPKRFLEDLHYSFVEYSGSNITHWSFLDENDGIDVERLCGKLFLIADRDEDKEERHKQLEGVLGVNFCLLPCREVENLLKEEIIRGYLDKVEGEFAKLIVVERNAYFDVPLGNYLVSQAEEAESKGKRKRTFKYAEKSGTLADWHKKELCDFAVSRMKQFSELTEEARKIAERLYEFIKKQNG